MSVLSWVGSTSATMSINVCLSSEGDMSLRKAAEKALDCLNYHWDNQDHELEDWPYVLEAKQALRQALAQPVDLAKVGEVGVWGEKPPTKRDNLSWVGLTDDEREHFRKLGFVGVLAVEDKLKDKNI
jgi:hypothetical protein